MNKWNVLGFRFLRKAYFYFSVCIHLFEFISIKNPTTNYTNMKFCRDSTPQIFNHNTIIL